LSELAICAGSDRAVSSGGLLLQEVNVHINMRVAVTAVRIRTPLATVNNQPFQKPTKRGPAFRQNQTITAFFGIQMGSVWIRASVTGKFKNQESEISGW
jgi:hypothetical protein